MENINKIYRVEITVSEYNPNDEGFYTIKVNTEVAIGTNQLISSVDSVYFSTTKYLEKRLIKDKKLIINGKS